MLTDIKLRRHEDVERLAHYVGQDVKISINPRWAADKKTTAIYITPERVIRNGGGEFVGVVAQSGSVGERIVVKTPNRSAGIKWWEFFGRNTLYVAPEARNDIQGTSFTRPITIQGFEKPPSVDEFVAQITRLYHIQRTALVGKSWMEISASNIGQSGIIDAQLSEWGRNYSWIRGAILSALEKYPKSELAKTLGTDEIAVESGKVGEIRKALEQKGHEPKTWKTLTSYLDVPRRVRSAVLQGRTVDEKIGALLIAEKLDAIKRLRRLRGA